MTGALSGHKKPIAGIVNCLLFFNEKKLIDLRGRRKVVVEESLEDHIGSD